MAWERRPSDLEILVGVDEDAEAGEGGAVDDIRRTLSQEDRRRHFHEFGRSSSFGGQPSSLEASSTRGDLFALASPDQSAESVLRSLAPKHSGAVMARLQRENVHSAADLAGLDKEDLRELGLTMVERSRVLSWARQAFPRSRGGSLEIVPGTPGMGEIPTEGHHRAPPPSCKPASVRGTPMGAPALQRHFSGDGYDRFTSLFEEGGLAPSLEREASDVVSSAEFWCRLVVDSGTTYLRADVEQVDELLRRGGEAANQINLSDLRENVLEKLFDLSPERVKEVYESVDRDSDGRILKEELREGMHRCELHGLDGALEKVLSFVSRDKKCLELSEFESVLTRLKLAQLLSVPKLQHQAAAEQLTILDYNSLRVEERKMNLRDFFFGHRARTYPMRWVHLRQFDLTLLLALTVKYQLHPLSVEDVIDQAPTKIDKYDCHYFASVEHLEVAGPTSGAEPVRVRGRHVTLFCAGPPHLDTVLTVSQADRSFQQDWPGGLAEGPGLVEDAWVGRLHKRLRAVRSRVRERRADFLMYEIIDLCTDDLRHVTRVYTARLNYLEDELQKCRLSSEQGKLDWFNEVGIMRLQLAVVARRLRGLQRILRRLADDQDLSTALVGYLQDVADHVNEAYEDAGHLGEKCTTLSAAYEHAEDRAQEKVHKEIAQAQTLQDERMNKMLFILTILTTVFTPLTFMAGIYGMNFQDGNGHPTIPELLLPHGYFWFLVGTLVYLVFSCVIGIWLWRRVSRGAAQPASLRLSGRTSSSAAPASWGSAQSPVNSNYAALP